MKAATTHTHARLPLLLRQLRLPTVAASYQRRAQEAAVNGEPYEQYLLALLEEEVAQRDVNRRKRRIQEARFPRIQPLADYDFALMPELSQQKVIQLTRCDFLEQAENIVFTGDLGTGKTHLAISVGLAACELGKRVRFFTAASLVNMLLEAAEQRRLSKLEATLMKQDLIIIDEVGFVPFSQQGANMLFTFVSQRYLRGSLLVTTNLPFADWGTVFGNALSVSPLLDRLTHRCQIFQFSGQSFRFRQSLARQQSAELISAETDKEATPISS